MTRVLDLARLDALQHLSNRWPDFLAGQLKAFSSDLAGRVVTADDSDYDAVRAECVWNGDIDRRPWAIARVRSADDVAAAVRFAWASGRDLAVRGGGHNFSGAVSLTAPS